MELFENRNLWDVSFELDYLYEESWYICMYI